MWVQDLRNAGVSNRAATFTSVNGTVSCFCNKRLQNWPTVYSTRTLPRDQRRGLLIALMNHQSGALDHQSVCLFSQIRLTKYLLQLELRRICSKDRLSYDREHFFKFFEYLACADCGSTGH